MEDKSTAQRIAEKLVRDSLHTRNSDLKEEMAVAIVNKNIMEGRQRQRERDILERDKMGKSGTNMLNSLRDLSEQSDQGS